MAGELPKDPKISLLGLRGVNLDLNDFQMPDGSWRRLVNGEFVSTGTRTRGTGQGGIRKRGGVAPWNDTALGGFVLAVAGVPLASEMDFNPRLILGCNSGGSASWKVSTDGAAFTDLATTVLPRPYENRAWVGIAYTEQRPPRAANYRRNVYYPSNNYTEANPPNDPPPIAVYTGDGQGYDVVDLPKSLALSSQAIAITDMVTANGIVYLTAYDTDGRGRALALDPRTGALSQVGPDLLPPSGSAMCCEYYQGRLWVGTFAIPGTAKGYIYSIRPGVDTAWTLERTSATNNGGYHQLIAFDDDLFAGTDADAVGTAVIERRTAAGVWSTSFTAASSGASRFSGAVVFDDKLFFGWYKGAATTASLIKMWNGSSWSTSLDIKATYALKAPGQPVVFEDAIYWPCFDSGTAGSQTNFCLKRTVGGVWSQVLTGAGLQGTAALYYPTPTT